MNLNLTGITLVVDRSGSMQSIKDDAEGGVNSFIAQQVDEDGDANVTIVEFDTKYDFVTNATPVQSVKPYKLVPRGGTALLDAVGRAINETGSRLSKLREGDRPGLVVFVIVTDGQENSSVEFDLQEVRKMIQHQQDVYNWQFTFLGADADAFGDAVKMGIAAGGAAHYEPGNVQKAYFHTGNKVKRMRQRRLRGEDVDNKFSVAEHDDMTS